MLFQMINAIPALQIVYHAITEQLIVVEDIHLQAHIQFVINVQMGMFFSQDGEVTVVYKAHVQYKIVQFVRKDRFTILVNNVVKF